MRFFHLYYIPVIPVAGRKRSHKMCPKCNTGRQIERSVNEALVATLKERSADALIAICEGEKTFVVPPEDTLAGEPTGGEPNDGEPNDGEPNVVERAGGEPSDCLNYLSGAFDWLYAAGEAEFCRGIVAKIQSPVAAYERQMLAATLATMDGNLDSAISAFQAAANVPGSDKTAPLLAGHLLTVRKRRDEAIATFESALAKTEHPEEQLQVLAALGEQQMAAKQFPEAAQSFQHMSELEPNLLLDKTFAKQIKRARKKSGVI